MQPDPLVPGRIIPNITSVPVRLSSGVPVTCMSHLLYVPQSWIVSPFFVIFVLFAFQLPMILTHPLAQRSSLSPVPCPDEPAKGVLRFRGRVSVSSVCFWFFPRVPALRSHARVFWHAACVTLQASLVRLACDSSSIPAASAADAALSLQTVRCALSSSLTAGRGVPGGRARGD